MKCYGYDRRDVGTGDTGDTVQLRELSEVSMVASARRLRQIAKFMNEVAEMIESDPHAFGHSHLRDHLDDWDSSEADLILTKDEESV